ncbi:polysaccharide lyase 6 family protein [Bythopirellula goksoeyrii]|uniref:Chondroitinase-B n=1 Tax=Bythopirellula goksoeyrii TaxID=1400387 RepID=A0A5B9QQR7_9BACT|nr:polysaccharide lyase 6 family protein [Bythopirellula goksoeyrii]QEG36471.1 Chondroitinase-B precursor [Bythopirellula goksoeyrii]
MNFTNTFFNKLLIKFGIVLLWGVSIAKAEDILVDDVPALEAALETAQPGDNILLREGEWRDAKIVFRGQGTNAAPIILKAATPGKTVITGKSILRMHGEYLVVEGLLFQDPDPSVSDLINFRLDSDELCHNCRMTDCTVIGTKQVDGSQESRWMGLYGSDNRVDHCNFEGKSDKGTTFVVWLGNGSGGRHRIDHNYFGPREKLGKNGGETIRIGDSNSSMIDAKCVIEKNLFEKCNGENECISNKSCGNIYRDNTFLEVSGTLTLRHGNDCLVEHNVFLGNKARGTGGIRIIGENHVVRGNYLEKLTGDDSRAGLSIMTGIPNSPLNRYFQVKSALVEDNVLVDCEQSLLIGLSDDKNASLPPVETIFRGNCIHAPKYTAVEARCDLDGITWLDNHFTGKELGISPVDGIKTSDGEWTPLEAIPRAEVGTTW